MGSRSTPWTAILTTLLFSGVGLAAIADTPRPSTQLSSGGGEALGMTAITMREATFNGPSDCAEIETPNTLIYLEHYATAEQRARLSVPEARDELRQVVRLRPRRQRPVYFAGRAPADGEGLSQGAGGAGQASLWPEPRRHNGWTVDGQHLRPQEIRGPERRSSCRQRALPRPRLPAVLALGGAHR